MRQEAASGEQVTSGLKLGTVVETESRWLNTVSVAMMAGIAFLPIVIAAGFLAEHLGAASVPREVSTTALRGPIDADRQASVDQPSVDRGAEHPRVRVHAGF